MKAAYITFVFCVALFSAVDSDDHASFVRCAKEHKVDEELVSDIFWKEDAVSDDKDVKCFFKCYLTAIKHMDKDGNLVEGPEYDYPKTLIKIMKDCRESEKVNDSDICEKAYKFTRCIAEKKLEAHVSVHDL